MIYFDSDVLIHYFVTQDSDKIIWLLNYIKVPRKMVYFPVHCYLCRKLVMYCPG